MKRLNLPSPKPSTQEQTPVTFTTQDGTSAPSASVLVIKKDSSKPRKFLLLMCIWSAEPLKAKTKMAAERKLIDKMATTGRPYLAPIELSKEIENKVRREKEETTSLRAELTQKVAHDMPRATKEAIDGTVTRLIYEQMHNAKVPEDPELTMKPDCSKTLKNEKTKVRFHNGKYEVRKFDEKGKKAWSCCQSKYEDGEGC